MSQSSSQSPQSSLTDLPPTTPHDALAELACTLLDAHCATLFLPSDATTATLVAAFSPNDPAPQPVSIAHGRGLVGWILRNKHALIVNDFDQKNAYLGYYDTRSSNHDNARDNANIRAFMGVPLPNGGALCLDRTHDAPFTEHEQRVLASLAKHEPLFARTATAMPEDNEVDRYFGAFAHLQTTRLVSTRWPETLATVLDTLHESTGFDYVAFTSLHESGIHYSREAENRPVLTHNGPHPAIPITQGVVGWVFRNEVPVHAEGTDNAPAAPLFGKITDMPTFQATLCLPVFMNKSLCGVLCLANMTPRTMSPALRTFAQMVVYELSQTLESLALRHRVHTLMPKARLYREGAVKYDPDTAPPAHLHDADN